MENSKQFIKPDQTNGIPPLNNDGVIYPDDTDRANILNNYFTGSQANERVHMCLNLDFCAEDIY